jgi:hypothetical protein
MAMQPLLALFAASSGSFLLLLALQHAEPTQIIPLCLARMSSEEDVASLFRQRVNFQRAQTSRCLRERAQVNSAGHGSPVHRCRVHACIYKG